MVFIDVRCDQCSKIVCEVSKDFFGLIRVQCRHCGKFNIVSLAVIIKQMADDSAILPSPAQVSTRT